MRFLVSYRDDRKRRHLIMVASLQEFYFVKDRFEDAYIVE